MREANHAGEHQKPVLTKEAMGETSRWMVIVCVPALAHQVIGGHEGTPGPSGSPTGRTEGCPPPRVFATSIVPRESRESNPLPGCDVDGNIGNALSSFTEIPHPLSDEVVDRVHSNEGPFNQVSG